METVSLFFENIMILANAMSFYILLGLLIAGVLKELIPDDFIARHLGKNKTSSVIKATLLGIPLPVCSCSVIPLAKSLQKEGASKGAVQSFLISTPITGADSILATYSFFGWVFTLYRVVTSVIIAIVTGILQNLIDSREPEPEPASKSCCSSCGCGHKEEEVPKKGFSFRNAVRYGYVTLFGDIYFSLLIGVGIGALFTTFLPKELLGGLYASPLLTYIAVLVVAMPLYVCATASLPIAAGFVLAGMSPGAAFVFLTAGPATNSVTMGVVASMFGRRSLALYIGTISLMSILFGYLLDTFWSGFDVRAAMHLHEESSLLQMISSVVMFSMILYYLVKEKIVKRG